MELLALCHADRAVATRDSSPARFADEAEKDVEREAWRASCSAVKDWARWRREGAINESVQVS